MKYRILLASSLLLTTSSSTVLAEGDAKELFTKLCASCHAPSGKPTVAPPIFAVINHVKNAYPNKSDFVERIVKWVNKPEKENTLMPGAVRRFGLMPKLPYKENEVRLIAEYLYDGKVIIPDWYKEHYKKEHGHEPRQ